MPFAISAGGPSKVYISSRWLLLAAAAGASASTIAAAVTLANAPSLDHMTTFLFAQV
ncbi:MAG TPA: hypothetical protein VFG86_01705 [Chloroflexota bacterium]|nr:hypothetical protein [Chloroflexota bacterium]